MEFNFKYMINILLSFYIKRTFDRLSESSLIRQPDRPTVLYRNLMCMRFIFSSLNLSRGTLENKLYK